MCFSLVSTPTKTQYSNACLTVVINHFDNLAVNLILQREPYGRIASNECHDTMLKSDFLLCALCRFAVGHHLFKLIIRDKY